MIKTSGMKSLATFGFKPVTVARRHAEMALDEVTSAEKEDAVKKARIEFAAAKKDERKKLVAETRKRIREAQIAGMDHESSDDEGRHGHGVIDFSNDDVNFVKQKRQKRPDGWRQMGKYAFQMGIAGAIAGGHAYI
jgi:hypothetical protein